MFHSAKPLPDVVDEKCWSDPHMLREKIEKAGESEMAAILWYTLTKTE